MVDEALVRRHLRDRTPVGTRLIVRGITTGGRPLPVREIVGVVGQVKEQPDEKDPEPHMFVPVAQDPPWQLSLVVQPAVGSAAALTSTVRAAIARVDKEQLVSVREVMTLEDVASDATSRHRFRAVMVMTFAAVALALATVGVFGLLAYTVQQRSREFGIRVALGAKPSQIIGMVVGQNLRIVAVGLIVGVAAAIPATRLLRGLLYQIGPNDPTTFVAIGAMLAAVAMIAAYLPARRGTQVDPVVTLKSE